MIPHLQGREAALADFGWTGRDAEWLALVCLHSGVFLRAQYLAFIGAPDPERAGRFVRRCGTFAVEAPWHGSGLRLCRIAARPLYRALGAEDLRHRRTASPAVLLRRLLSLDYVLEHPDAPWLPTEEEKVGALTAAGLSTDLLPSRLYQGAVDSQRRYFVHKLPLALDATAVTFVFVQTDDTTESAVSTWGQQHAALWAALTRAGRRIDVVVVGRDPVRLTAAARALGSWTRPPADDADEADARERAAELAAVRAAIAGSDTAALAAYGGLNGAVARCALLETAAEHARAPRPTVTTVRTWRSSRVPR